MEKRDSKTAGVTLISPEAVPVRGGRLPEAVHRPQQPTEARQGSLQGGAGHVQGQQGAHPVLAAGGPQQQAPGNAAAPSHHGRS